MMRFTQRIHVFNVCMYVIFGPNDVNASVLTVFKSRKNLNISYNNTVRIFTDCSAYRRYRDA